MTTDRAIPMTDARGAVLMRVDEDEPLPGSVVLTEGQHGSAWQRFFSDGLWHPVRGGGPRTWEHLLTKRNLVLVYDAPERDRR